MKKLFLFLGFVALLLILYFLTPVRHYLSQDGFTQMEHWIRAQGFWAPLAFGLVYVVATVFALPGSVLTIGGGLIFGPLWGTVINWLSACTGAILSFLIARYLGRDAVEKILKGRGALRGLDDKIGNNGFYSVLVLRLVPLFPFNILNYGLGLTQVSFRHYMLATLLGMLPGTFVYTSLGSAGRHLSFSDPSTWLRIQVWGPFVLVVLLTAGTRLLTRRKPS